MGSFSGGILPRLAEEQRGCGLQEDLANLAAFGNALGGGHHMTHCWTTLGKAAVLPVLSSTCHSGPLLLFCAGHLFLRRTRTCLLPTILTATSVMPDMPEAWARDSG